MQVCLHGLLSTALVIDGLCSFDRVMELAFELIDSSLVWFHICSGDDFPCLMSSGCGSNK